MSEKKSNCTDWSAVHDFMPPRPPRLTVRGKCTFPTPGYTVTFKKHVPQGISPLVLLLDKIVTPPSGLEPQIVTTIAVEYEEVTSVRYIEVDILDVAKIKVEDVS
jgi:hypothetical protein